MEEHSLNTPYLQPAPIGWLLEVCAFNGNSSYK